MINRKLILGCIALCAVEGPVQAAAEDQPPSAYQAVMKAQLSARQPETAARPEEVQKIYDTYLESIGRSKTSAERSDDTSTLPSH